MRPRGLTWRRTGDLPDHDYDYDTAHSTVVPQFEASRTQQTLPPSHIKASVASDVTMDAPAASR